MKQLSVIKSRQNDIVKNAITLKKKPSADMFFLEGTKFVLDTPKSRIKQLFITNPEKHAEFAQQCLNENAQVYAVTEAVMEKLCDAVSGQEVAAFVSAPIYTMPDKLVLLDGVRDSGNAGTIIRSAAAFGFGCILSQDSANPFAGKTVRSTAGAIMSCYVKKTDLTTEIQNLKANGYKILSSELDKNARVMHDFSVSGKIALIIGSEGQGVSRQISELADEKIYIPIFKTQSLNASVAAGILMCHFAK